MMKDTTMYKHPAEANWYARNADTKAVTFVEAIERLADTERGFTFLDREHKEHFYSFAALKAEAAKRASALRALGVRPGDRVALVLPDPADFVLTFMGVVFAGGVAVPMYPPLSLGKLDQYIDGAARILDAAGASLLITSKQVETVLWPVISKVPSLSNIVAVEDMKGDAVTPPNASTLSELVFLQFTSGSTSEPKGVRVTHSSLFENSKAIAAAMDADGARDHGVSWLPLYHDMGLIGFVLLPIIWQIPVTFIPTMSFIRKPTLWLDVITKKKGTITFAPNFAYALMAKRANNLSQWDLSSLRIAGCGAEPIQVETMQRFADTFAAAGFKAESLLPCYGMAEATLAVTFNRLGTPLKVDVIDKQHYRDHHEAKPMKDGVGMNVVSCGVPFVGHEVAIIDDNGRRVGERVVGEVIFSGPSVADGYYQRDSEAFADGWLRTGDFGYLADGELYICGRKKDLIIVKGRNYHPQSIEWAVEQLPNVRKGNIVAFSVSDGESEALVIAAETSLKDNRHELQSKIRTHINEQFGLSAKDVVLVGSGQLPKTSSGKLQRAKARTLYLSGELERQGNRTMGTGANSVGAKIGLAMHVMKSVTTKIKHRIGAGQ